MLAETFTELLFSWPHWALELTVEAVTTLALFPLGRLLWRRGLKRHDEVEHPAPKPVYEGSCPRCEHLKDLHSVEGYATGCQHDQCHCPIYFMTP